MSSSRTTGADFSASSMSVVRPTQPLAAVGSACAVAWTRSAAPAHAAASNAIPIGTPRYARTERLTAIALEHDADAELRAVQRLLCDNRSLERADADVGDRELEKE